MCEIEAVLDRSKSGERFDMAELARFLSDECDVWDSGTRIMASAPEDVPGVLLVMRVSEYVTAIRGDITREEAIRITFDDLYVRE